MELWKASDYHTPFTIGPFSIEFFDAGHILGSAFIKITAEGKSVVFSGDLGNYPAPIIMPTDDLPDADYCLIESTYGNRTHEGIPKRREHLEDAIEDTVKKGGVLLIPAFAMERTQDLLFHLNELVENGRVPKIPIIIDSPLAIKLTRVFKKHEKYFNDESVDLIENGDDILHFPGLHLTLTTEQSKRINDIPAPKVIIAGSGMSQGGRILHHERRYLSDSKSTILFVGYQSSGSLGRRILEGAKTVKIFGEEIPIRCEIRSLPGYSAHADQPRLIEWLTPKREFLKKVFVVQGDEDASDVLAQKIRDTLAIDAIVPEPGESVVL
jgi:metallo-beta-lactamase family protein